MKKIIFFIFLLFFTSTLYASEVVNVKLYSTIIVDIKIIRHDSFLSHYNDIFLYCENGSVFKHYSANVPSRKISVYQKYIRHYAGEILTEKYGDIYYEFDY